MKRALEMKIASPLVSLPMEEEGPSRMSDSNLRELNLNEKLNYISNLFDKRGAYTTRFEYIFTIWVSDQSAPKTFPVSLLCDLATSCLKEKNSHQIKPGSIPIVRKSSRHQTRKTSSSKGRSTVGSQIAPPPTKDYHQLHQERLGMLMKPIINNFLDRYQKQKRSSLHLPPHNALQKLLEQKLSLRFYSNVYYSLIKDHNLTYLIAYPTEPVATVCSAILQKELTYMVMGLQDDLPRS